jgi:hypothetical protein
MKKKILISFTSTLSKILSQTSWLEGSPFSSLSYPQGPPLSSPHNPQTKSKRIFLFFFEKKELYETSLIITVVGLQKNYTLPPAQ